MRAIVSLIQSLIVIGLGLLVGAHFPGGVAGLAVLIVCSALLGGSLSALSNGMALLARKEETVIAASNFVLLPLTFLSSAFMQRDLMPGWIQTVARYNPVEWTVQAGREALTASPDWGLVLSRTGLLAALWGLIVPIVGLTQRELVPGSAHWVIQVIHLLLGIGLIALAENLATRAKAGLAPVA